MVNNKVLGTSLSSLINDKIATNNMNWVNIEKIVPNEAQPRKFFDPQALLELSKSIKSNGVLQPILVFPTSFGKYKIISGERRYRASIEAGLTKMPVIIKDVKDKEILKLSLIENLQREDITMIEEAKSYKHLLNFFGYSHSELGEMLGKSRSYVSNVIRLLVLPIEVQDMLEKGEISYGHARAIIGATNACDIAQQIKAKDLTVREVEQLVTFSDYKKKRKSNVDHAKSDKNSISKTQDLEDFQYISEIIANKLGMKISLKASKNGKGTISIFFSNPGELEKFLNKL